MFIAKQMRATEYQSRRFIVMIRIGPLLGIVASLLGGCKQQEKHSAQSGCATQHEVHLYVTNMSFLDSLATARLSIDDSVYVNQEVPTSRTSASHATKLIRLCQGMHRVSAKFGLYSKDTTLRITNNASLMIAMDHETAYQFNNGVTIALLIRDGYPTHTAID